jgi:hypothetical protein
MRQLIIFYFNTNYNKQQQKRITFKISENSLGNKGYKKITTKIIILKILWNGQKMTYNIYIQGIMLNDLCNKPYKLKNFI